jgi:molecular chaperone DnaJ
MTTAALGGTIEAPTIDGGKVSIKVPEGTQTGERMRLRQKGMVKLNAGGARGEMFVELFRRNPAPPDRAPKRAAAGIL